MKADRLRSQDYPQTPSDYKLTNLRLVMDIIWFKLEGQAIRQMDGPTDATERIISLLSQSFVVNKIKMYLCLIDRNDDYSPLLPQSWLF